MKKLFVLFTLFILASCQQQNEPIPAEFSGSSMTMPYKILIGDTLTDEQSKQIITQINATFKEINSLYNNWNPYSELSMLNSLSVEMPQKLSQKLLSFLMMVDQIVTLTEGHFDPSIAPMMALWEKALLCHHFPQNAEWENISAATGWNQIHFQNGIFTKDHLKTSLDLCGVAKGYTIDLLTNRLQALGLCDFMIEWAGEIRAQGKHPAGRDWMITMQHHHASFPLYNRAVATSGNTMRAPWAVDSEHSPDGKSHLFCHIIDPLTKQPMEMGTQMISHVTVIAPTCALADALSTAAMTFKDVELARQWANRIVKKNPDISFWISTQNQPITQLSSP